MYELKMKKNQLVIYPKYATQQIIYEYNGNENCEIAIPISNSVLPQKIRCSHSFEVKTINGQNQLMCRPKNLESTKSNALVEIHQETINTFIKIESIQWKPTFTLSKDLGELNCHACITNQSNLEYQTNDIKLVFRSVDHKYKKEKDDRDIPTIDSSNFAEYKLKDRLPETFVLKNHITVDLWNHNVEMKEFVKVNIDIEKPKYVHSFLSFKVPELMLPGEMEILYRLENNDLLHLGSIYNKIYWKDDELQIMFPMNRSIKIKNNLEIKSHSFFIEKTTCKLESKIKKFYKHPLNVKLYTNRIIKDSSLPYSLEDDLYYWEICVQESETIFKLDFQC